LNLEIISLLFMHQVSIHSSQREQSETLTNRKSLTTPSIIIPTILSPSISNPPFTICTQILIVVCCPNLTIFVPARQFQHTSALSAPALTRFSEDKATAQVACELLEEGECHGGEEVDAAVWCGVA
jgi:hypothetical protein